MSNLFKRSLSLIVAVVMVLAMMPTNAFTIRVHAAENQNAATAEEFATALQEVDVGGTITVTADIADLDVTINKNVTVDLGGKTLTDAYIKIAAKVTVQNGSIKNVNEPYPLVVNSGELTVANLAIEASKSDRAIWARENTTVNFEDGSSILATKGANNTNSKIYGILVAQGATANINGGTIEVDAGADATAVAIFGNYTNTVNVNGGKISTSGKNYSYAIWADGDVTITGGEIVTNEKQYGYSSGVTYGYNYAINTKGDVEITGGTITTNGFKGYLVNGGGSNQTVTISDVEFTNVLTDVDKTTGGHSEPNLIKGSNVTAEITGGEFKGVSEQLITGTGSTLTVSGGDFDAIKPEYVETGAVITVAGVAQVKTESGTMETVEYVAQTGSKKYISLQDAIDAAVNGDTVTLLTDCAEDVTVTQAPDVKITIDGGEKTLNGTITVDGKSAAYETAGLTIKNVKFDATGIAAEACINLGVPNDNDTRYTSNVTVENCTFTGGNREKVAIKSYTGGDKNLTVTKCAVDDTMHSLLQAANITGVVIDECTVNSKNGINLNSSSNVEIKNSTVDVSGYAVRAGASGGTSGQITLTDNTLKTDNSEGDAVIVLRGTASEQIDLDMSGNVVSGDTHISGTAAGTDITANANYWDGKSAPVVSGTAVEVDTYYTDETLDSLKKNYLEGSGVEAAPYEISNAEELFLFAEKVNNGSYKNVYAVLTADIDLEQEDWISIGTSANPFTGTFDGQGHTISNLWSYERGLFGYTSTGNYVDSGKDGRATIKNLTVDGAEVYNQSTSAVGGIVGQANQNTELDNVKLTGYISIYGYGYVGGIVGQGYVHVNDCHVIGEADEDGNMSQIDASYWAVAGIVGHAGSEGGSAITDCSVKNVKIRSTYYGAGAIAGVGTDGPIEDVSAESVVIEAESNPEANGALVGCNYDKVTGNSTAKNVTLTVDGTPVEIMQDMVAEVDGVLYADLQAALNVGGAVKVLNDITLTEGVTVPAGKAVTLDLNGKTISQTKAQTEGYQMILNDGNLTIADSVGGGKISYTDSGNGGEYISDTIYNRGVLVINGGTIENLSSATVAANGYPHAVDNYSGIRDTSVTINGGTVYCAEYSAIRMFCVSATYKADLIINGGTIQGAIDMQNGTKDAALGSLTVNGGTFETTKNANNIRFANWNGGATEYGITASILDGSFNGGISTQYVPAAANWNKKIISGGTFAVAPADELLTEGSEFKYANGVFTVVPVKIASVNGVDYATLTAALDAAETGDEITLLTAITVEAGETLTIDKAVTITYTSDVLGEAMFTNKGTMVIDGATIVFTYTGEPDANYGKGNYTISNVGTLTLKNGTVENATAEMSHASYAIDNNSINSDATLTIEGGKVINKNNYAIRQIAGNGTNTIEIKGGEVTGTRAIWIQLASDNSSVAPVVNLTVSGGTLTGTKIDSSDNKLAIYSYSYGNDMKNVKIDITGGVFNGDIALTGGKNKTNIETVKVSGGEFYGYWGELYSYGDEAAAAKAITIEGGIFKTNAAEVYAKDDGFDFVKNADGYYEVTRGDDVAYTVDAEGNKVFFDDLAEALEAADKATDPAQKVVTLFADVTANTVMVCENVTLDLNGKTLEAGYMMSFGDIIDGTTDRSGLLVVESNRFVIRDANKFMPIRTTAGYRFFEVTKINAATNDIVDADGTVSGKKYQFKVYLDPACHELVKAGKDTTGMKIVVRVSWQAEQGVRTQNFEYSDEQVKTFIESYNAETGKYGKAFTLTLKSINSYEGLTLSACVVADRGYEFAATPEVINKEP